MSTFFFPIPRADLKTRDRIWFLHPGYDEGVNQLLSLPRVDRVATELGVHHGTALVACQIIAGNKFKTGSFSLDQAGKQRVNLPLDAILTKSQYYFILGDQPDQYAIVPSFRDWEFPHGEIPESWPEVTPTPTTLDSRCTVSNFSFAIDNAHLVPREEVAWFQINGMHRYGRGEFLRDINCQENLIPLKKDLHACFDDRWFAIVPKADDTTATPPSKYVTHILRGVAAELWPTYHNVGIQYISPNARPFLFARFAWAILLHVKPFLLCNIPRHVIRAQVNDKGKVEYSKQVLDGLQLDGYYGGGGSKGATPRKRAKADGAADEDSEASMDSWAEDWQTSQEPGERRRRQKSSETTVEEDQAHQLAVLKSQLERVLPEGRDKLAQLSESPTG